MSFVFTFLSGITLILYTLIISLLFMIIEERLFYKKINYEDGTKPHDCTFSYHLLSDGFIPNSLLIACLSQLLIFLFIPMGTLPQFISTPVDIFIIVFLMLFAHGFYIRGVKSFSKERYQSMEDKEVSLLFNFASCLLFVGGTFSWYVLNRGLPGYIFSIDAYSAMPLWRVTAVWGKAGLFLFFLLLSIASPNRKVIKLCRSGVITLSEIFEAVSPTVGSAIIAAIFMPHKIGLLLGLSGVAMFTIDYFCFWLQLFLLQLFIIPAIKKYYLQYKAKLPYNFNLLPSLTLAFFGFVFMMLDLYL